MVDIDYERNIFTVSDGDLTLTIENEENPLNPRQDSNDTVMLIWDNADMAKDVKRDTTRDLFYAVMKLVQESGQYKKAEAIMDYFLPRIDDPSTVLYEPVALSNYRFDVNAVPYYGGSEGIYLSLYLDGEFTEEPFTKYNHTTGQIENQYRLSIASFKTLRRDLEAMQIMGELCGTLTHYANQYINENIDRYTPSEELQKQHERRGHFFEGDKNPYKTIKDFIHEFKNHGNAFDPQNTVILPIYLDKYDKNISDKNPNGTSRRIGFIYTTYKDVVVDFDDNEPEKTIKEYLVSQISEYNNYVNKNTCGFTVTRTVEGDEDDYDVVDGGGCFQPGEKPLDMIKEMSYHCDDEHYHLFEMLINEMEGGSEAGM